MSGESFRTMIDRYAGKDWVGGKMLFGRRKGNTYYRIREQPTGEFVFEYRLYRSTIARFAVAADKVSMLWVEFSTCGWDTPTTWARLRCLFYRLRINVRKTRYRTPGKFFARIAGSTSTRKEWRFLRINSTLVPFDARATYLYDYATGAASAPLDTIFEIVPRKRTPMQYAFVNDARGFIQSVFATTGTPFNTLNVQRFRHQLAGALGVTCENYIVEASREYAEGRIDLPRAVAMAHPRVVAEFGDPVATATAHTFLDAIRKLGDAA